MVERVKSVFGKDMDLGAIEGIALDEILRTEQDLLNVEGGNPDFVYVWINARDPACAIKVRKGLYELVTPDTDPNLVCTADWDSQRGEYRLNELVLCRVPKKKWDQLQAAYLGRALVREKTIAEEYRGRVGEVTSAAGLPEEAAEPYLREQENVKFVKESPRKRIGSVP